MVAELQVALGAEASEMEILELAHLLCTDQVAWTQDGHAWRSGTDARNAGVRSDGQYRWRVVTEEWQGEDAYAANQSIEDLIDWQLMAAEDNE